MDHVEKQVTVATNSVGNAPSKDAAGGNNNDTKVGAQSYAIANSKKIVDEKAAGTSRAPGGTPHVADRKWLGPKDLKEAFSSAINDHLKASAASSEQREKKLVENKSSQKPNRKPSERNTKKKAVKPWTDISQITNMDHLVSVLLN